MTEPQSPEDPTEVIVTVPLDPSVTVGSVIRPPRPVTIGRRRSDRWLAWSIVALIGLQALFIMAVALRLDQLACPLGGR